MLDETLFENDTPLPFEKEHFNGVGSADHDLRRRVLNFLVGREMPESDLLTVDAQHGTVVISGTLPSRRAKRLCIACCRRVAGVLNVIDEVHVC